MDPVGREAMTNTVIFCAPQGWGKSRRAAELKREFGCTDVEDDWHPFVSRKPYARKPTAATVTPGTLHLTNVSPDLVRELLPNVVNGNQARIVVRGWSEKGGE
uniref:Uncharacterized protein n=1 Tax=biofilter metagenome TaxID=1070537 RepID=A0A1A7GDM8_9ZZZZ